MLSWPAVSQLLATVQPKVPSLDLSLLERDIPIPTLGTQSHNGKVLPVNAGLASRGSAPIPVSSLNWDTMHRLSKAYFDSINLVYPILDRQTFMSETLPSVLNQGFGGHGISSTIAFLVLALGETAIAGSEGQPVHIHAHNGRPSGVRGGSKDEPPGLDMFNEARKRMGFNLTECSLENVQIFALASLYYGTCFHLVVCSTRALRGADTISNCHTYLQDFWRMNTLASLACQALITRFVRFHDRTVPKGSLDQVGAWR